MPCSCNSAESYPASLGQGDWSSAMCLPVISEQSWCSAGNMEATGFFFLSRCMSSSQAWALLSCRLGHSILQGRCTSDEKRVPLNIEKVPGRQANYLRSISANPAQAKKKKFYLASNLSVESRVDLIDLFWKMWEVRWDENWQFKSGDCLFVYECNKNERHLIFIRYFWRLLIFSVCVNIFLYDWKW